MLRETLDLSAQKATDVIEQRCFGKISLRTGDALQGTPLG
jgi:hypothetical protein